MDRWEYHSHVTHHSESANLAAFNLLGAQGWELCGLANGRAWFKRSIVKRELAIQGGSDLAVLSNLAEGEK